MKDFDIVIVGAGGAGLMAARELGKLKYKTLLIDRNADLLAFSFNTLGSFMDLKHFGLTENVVAQPIKKAKLYSKNFIHSLNLKMTVNILDKRKVHEELLASLDPNFVKVLPKTSIKDINYAEDGSISSISDATGKKYEATVFVDATGLSGVLSKKCGLQEAKCKMATGVEYNVRYKGNPQEGHLLVGKIYQGGYAWIFPLKNERAIIGFGSYHDVVVKELKKRLDLIIDLPHIKKLVEKDNEKCEGGSLPLTEVLDQFVYKNLVCIGDSVSQINPIIGEGYKFIFESTIFATKAIDEALKNNDLSLLKNYEVNWKSRFLKQYLFGKEAQKKIFRYSRYDFLVDLVILKLKIKPSERVEKLLSGEYYR